MIMCPFPTSSAAGAANKQFSTTSIWDWKWNEHFHDVHIGLWTFWCLDVDSHVIFYCRYQFTFWFGYYAILY